jgi:nicotinamidase-related amidase
MTSAFGVRRTRWLATMAVAAAAIALAVVAGVAGARKEQKPAGQTALLIIDVQQFYFPGGLMPLEGPEAASRNCARLIEKFRSAGQTVIHVGHNASKEKSFHPDVAPLENEKVFYKDDVSAFNGTGLLAYLRERGIERLVVCGMMTHMCVEGTVRAAHDLGFQCVLVGDACATRDLEFGGRTVSAADVQTSTLATLDRAYATVVDTETFLVNY